LAPVWRRVSRVDSSAGGALYVVALHDRSEQVRIAQALEVSAIELQATLESMADGILVTDLAGRIRHFNQRFAAMWEVPGDLLVRREDDAVFDWMRRSVAEPSAYMRRLAALEASNMTQASDVLQLNSGKRVERVTLPQSSRGGLIGRVYSFRDITQQAPAKRKRVRCVKR
jgi:PAS domain-containing protein